MAPRQVDKGKVLAAAWDVQSHVLAEVPFSRLVSRENLEVNFSTIWGDVGYTAILGPGNFPVAWSILLVHGRVANVLAAPTSA